MLICKQAYQETIQLYYKCTSFRFVDPAVGYKWLTRIPRRYVTLITDIYFDVARFHDDMTPGRAFLHGRRSLIEPLEHLQEQEVTLRAGLMKSSFRSGKPGKVGVNDEWSTCWFEDAAMLAQALDKRELRRVFLNR